MADQNNSIPGFSLKIFTADRYEIKTLESVIQLPAWAGYQSRKGPYGNTDTNKPSDGSVTISIGTEKLTGDPEITAEHAAAYHYLVEQQDKIQSAILSKLLLQYNEMQEEYGNEEEDAGTVMPAVHSTEDFKPLIGLSEIHLLNVNKDGVAYTGYEFGCNWDEEHGLGVMMNKDRVIELGGADISFLTWIAERYLDPEKVNAEIEANRQHAEKVLKKAAEKKKLWWKFW